MRSIFSKDFQPQPKHLCRGCGQYMFLEEIGVKGSGPGFHNVECARKFYERQAQDQ